MCICLSAFEVATFSSLFSHSPFPLFRARRVTLPGENRAVVRDHMPTSQNDTHERAAFAATGYESTSRLLHGLRLSGPLLRNVLGGQTSMCPASSGVRCERKKRSLGSRSRVDGSPPAPPSSMLSHGLGGGPAREKNARSCKPHAPSVAPTLSTGG